MPTTVWLAINCTLTLGVSLGMVFGTSAQGKEKKEEHGDQQKKEEHGAAPKKEEHGAAPKKDEHGAAPKTDEHGAAPKKEEHGDPHKKEEHGAAPKKDEHGGGHKKEAKPVRPKRTFEGIEPLFYLDDKRHPFDEPFQKKEGEEFYLCRANVGEWYREMNVADLNRLAAKDNLNQVSGSTCALHLFPSSLGKKLPYLMLEFYTGSDGMRECILTEECPQVRTVIMYLKDKTLYRSLIITDSKKHVHRQYCLDNKSQVLAEKACWRHFQDLSLAKREAKLKGEEEDNSPQAQRKKRREENEAKKKSRDGLDSKDNSATEPKEESGKENQHKADKHKEH